MIPTPRQTRVHYGLGAVNYHTGETGVIIRKRKHRLGVAELLQMLVEKHLRSFCLYVDTAPDQFAEFEFDSGMVTISLVPWSGED